MFRFTIRELILLTVIAAMGAAWWVDRRGWIRRVQAGAIEIIDIHFRKAQVESEVVALEQEIKDLRKNESQSNSDAARSMASVTGQRSGGKRW